MLCVNIQSQLSIIYVSSDYTIALYCNSCGFKSFDLNAWYITLTTAQYQNSTFAFAIIIIPVSSWKLIQLLMSLHVHICNEARESTLITACHFLTARFYTRHQRSRESMEPAADSVLCYTCNSYSVW